MNWVLVHSLGGWLLPENGEHPSGAGLNWVLVHSLGGWLLPENGESGS